MSKILKNIYVAVFVQKKTKQFGHNLFQQSAIVNWRNFKESQL